MGSNVGMRYRCARHVAAKSILCSVFVLVYNHTASDQTPHEIICMLFINKGYAAGASWCTLPNTESCWNVLGTWIESVKSFMKWLVIARSCVSIMTSFVQQRPVVNCLGIYNSWGSSNNSVWNSRVMILSGYTRPPWRPYFNKSTTEREREILQGCSQLTSLIT